MKSSPRSPQLEEARVQQQGPNAAKKKKRTHKGQRVGAYSTDVGKYMAPAQFLFIKSQTPKNKYWDVQGRVLVGLPKK